MADIEYKTPQDVADEKARKAQDAAYNKSLTTTELAPAKKSAAEPAKKAESTKKLAKGGTASSRADGIASRGKTNCKMY